MRKTKIVATIGPATDDEAMLKKIIEAGVNVCRLNFSHGNYEEHKKRIQTIKKIREEMGSSIAIMLDTKGPEIRLGNFKDDQQIELCTNASFTLTTEDILGDQRQVSISYANLPQDVSVGDRILIDDGLIELKVQKVTPTTIETTVLNGGKISGHKGVNVPNVQISLPALTKKDLADIEFGIAEDIDFIAASFIRKAEDVINIRRVLEEKNAQHIEIIAKIENQEGVDNLDDIIRVSDGIMVARGDLGVEIAPEDIPVIQKEMIRKCHLAGKPVITATQMLDSMMRNPRPTRAEVTDVANSILDGTSAIMLSGETAAGKYPIEAVETMSRIALRMENSLDYLALLQETTSMTEITTTNAIAKAVCVTAYDLQASAIVAATSSGYTARVISKFRPKSPIIAAITDPRAGRKLSLDWGVYPTLSVKGDSTDEILENALKSAQEQHYIKEGDLVVLTAGVPVGMSGSTNLIKVHTLGKLLALGIGIGHRTVTGRVVVGQTADELLVKFSPSDIIVTPSTDRDMVSLMKNASAIVVEEGGLTSHAAISALNLHIPTIIGATDILSKVKDGDIITVDTGSGQVYRGHARLI